MAYYRVCPDCGCNLDPGERCDCWRDKERIQGLLTVGADGQMKIKEFSNGSRELERRKGNAIRRAI